MTEFVGCAMRLFTLLGLLLLLVLPTYAQEDAPYLYYYSNVLKGIVVERADGTDSRVLGRGLVDEDVLWTEGPGWSADGTWFAWHVKTAEGGGYQRAIAKSYAVRVDGQTLPLLSEFPCVHQVYWHPTDNILLVYGSVAKNNDCVNNGFLPFDTYWLVDADNQELLAMFSFGPRDDTMWRPRMYWKAANETVQFIVDSYTYADKQYIRYFYVITMHFDGRVLMEPISLEEAYAGLGELPPDSSGRPDPELSHFRSWSRYPDERVAGVPPAVDYRGGIVAGQWDASGEWLLVGHEFCRSDCAYVVGAVSIFHPSTQSSRELSDCGGHPSCVGWLPQHVDVASLAPGRSESVLPTPIEIHYSPEPAFSRFFEDVATHNIVCNPDNRRRDQVTAIETGEVVFVLPVAEQCKMLDQPERVVFALSPDERYYAMTTSSQYTSLYEAATGGRIMTVNFYGEELAFSEDSRRLITTSGSATAIWATSDTTRPSQFL